MKLLIVAKLLQNTDGIRNAGYIAFSLSVLCYFFYAWQSIGVYLSLIVIFILCLLQHYLSIRVKFDAELLSLIGTNSGNSEEIPSIAQKTQRLDQSLLELGLIPAKKQQRSWEVRIQGCMRLFKLHVVMVLCQYIVLISLMIFLLQQK
ncbi:hypothetical protein [Acinetobacter sp. ANC 4178]|uniref:hypothetical protein n=1 Tax=Acinetobacter sp. ANC 4178 TaxID=2529839 RepID=UPI00103E6A56|nr:hypothetical protein [Acinetobacter sp. ANC 4178]TCB66438.1 hypothetical protein E0H87_10260 [Acinetobacter sp. ANC 4178]